MIYKLASTNHTAVDLRLNYSFFLHFYHCKIMCFLITDLLLHIMHETGGNSFSYRAPWDRR